MESLKKDNNQILQQLQGLPDDQQQQLLEIIQLQLKNCQQGNSNKEKKNEQPDIDQKENLPEIANYDQTNKALEYCKDLEDKIQDNDQRTFPQNYKVIDNIQGIELRLLKQCEISQQDRQNAIKILLIGQTGVGKTTLINSLVNHLFGIKIEDPFRYLIINTIGSQTNQHESQTSAVSEYLIPSQDICKRPILVIDTPGFGDTKGVQQDEIIAQKVAKYLKTQLDELHAIGFVVKASDNRLTEYSKYVMDQVLKQFGKDAEKNIYMLFTFADGGRVNALNQVKKHKVPFKDFFKINNSAIFPEDEQYNIKDDFILKFWEVSCKALKDFQAQVYLSPPISLKLTKKILEIRDAFKDYLLRLQADIQNGLVIIESLKDQLRQFKANKKNIEENKNFTYTVTEARKRKNYVNHYTTVCHNCVQNCHENCAYKDNDDKAKCCAMDSSGNCKICPQKCSWRNHTNTGYLWESYTWSENRTYDSKKAAYNNAKSTQSVYEQQIGKIVQSYKDHVQQLASLIANAQSCVNTLNKLALKPTNGSFQDYVTVLIKREEDEKKQGWKQRVDELRKIRDQSDIEYKLFNGQLEYKLGSEIEDEIKEQTRKDGTLEDLNKKSKCNIF